MPDDDVTVEGLEELSNKLQELGTNITRNALTEALTQAAEIIQHAIEDRSPYGPHYNKYQHDETWGIIENTIGYVITLDHLNSMATATIGPHRLAFWARFEEFGTIHESARPFIRPAFDESKNAALDKFKDVLKEYVEAYLPQ